MEVAFLLELEYYTGGIFSKIFGNLSELISEVWLEFTDECLKFTALNQSHTIFVEASLKYDEVHLDNDINMPLQVGVDTIFMSKIVKRIGKKPFRIQVDNHFMKIISGEEEEYRSFKVPLLDIAYEQQKPPNIEPHTSVCLPVSWFKETLKDFQLVTKQAFKIDIKQQGISLYTDNEYETSEVRATKSIHWENDVEPFTTSFSIEYLDMIMKFAFNDTLIFQCQQDMPGIFIFDDEFNQLKFLVAPRLDHT